MTIPLFTLFVASLLGSPHCFAMCGGFVTFYAAQSQSSTLSHAAYNIGRLLTYCTAGALAGFAGEVLNRSGSLLGIERFAAILMGSSMIAWGILSLVKRSPPGIPISFHSQLLGALTKKMRAGRAKTRSIPYGAFLIGITSTLLPCGWLYGFLALAAASSDAGMGALCMAIFWLGTLPAMLVVGTLSQKLIRVAGPLVPRFTAVLVTLSGLCAIFSHLTTSQLMEYGAHGANSFLNWCGSTLSP